MLKAFASAIFASVAVAQNDMITSDAYMSGLVIADDYSNAQQEKTMTKEDVTVAVKKAVEEAVTPPVPAKDIEDAVANGIVKATETLRKERKERWTAKKQKWSNKKKEIKKEWTKKKAEIKVKLQEKKKEIKKTIKKIEKKIEKKFKVDRKER
jgi:hypothetical protein